MDLLKSRNISRYFTLIASFVIMLCLGGVYAWSIIASELIDKYSFSATQTQIIFGILIASFPVTMIFVGQLAKKIKPKYIGFISSLFFIVGYLSASYSKGNFIIYLIGLGLLTGVSTGFGYWVSLTIPVQLFPEKKGLITGITAAGFGLGSVVLSNIAEILLKNGKSVDQLLLIIGISYSIVIFIFSNLIIYESQLKNNNSNIAEREQIKFYKSKIFYKLLVGILLGTFAGLLVIGSLKLIGEQGNISTKYLVFGVSLLSIANFLGRLSWGFLSDKFEASFNIFLALLVQAIGILFLDLFLVSEITFLIYCFIIGFGFGGNFVLFAKETAHIFGVNKIGTIYPYVFLGYAIAGILGPLSGGALFDIAGNYTNAIYLATFMSLLGSLLFLQHYIKERKLAKLKK